MHFILDLSRYMENTMPFDYKECIKKGLIRPIPPSSEKALRSLEKADKWLEEADQSLQAVALNTSIIASYLAMFHAARSMLFYDGYREKSHACIARYLEDIYVRKKLLEREWVELLDYYRELRHGDQYDVSFFASIEEAKTALAKARAFVKRMYDLHTTISRTAVMR